MLSCRLLSLLPGRATAAAGLAASTASAGPPPAPLAGAFPHAEGLSALTQPLHGFLTLLAVAHAVSPHAGRCNPADDLLVTLDRKSAAIRIQQCSSGPLLGASPARGGPWGGTFSTDPLIDPLFDLPFASHNTLSQTFRTPFPPEYSTARRVGRAHSAAAPSPKRIHQSKGTGLAGGGGDGRVAAAAAAPDTGTPLRVPQGYRAWALHAMPGAGGRVRT